MALAVADAAAASSDAFAAVFDAVASLLSEVIEDTLLLVVPPSLKNELFGILYIHF